MSKRPYTEGSVFAVPLRIGGYARGVVARQSKRGGVLIGYFFGPRLLSNSDVTNVDLKPGKALMRLLFGDLGLMNGEWRVTGTIANWERSEWPVPQFVRRDELSRKAWLVRYSDDDPNLVEEESPIDFDSKLDPDSLAGYGAVEAMLTTALAEVP